MVNETRILRQGIDTLCLFIGKCGVDWKKLYDLGLMVMPEMTLKYKGVEFLRRREYRKVHDVCLQTGHFRFFVGERSALIEFLSIGFVRLELETIARWLCDILDRMNADSETGEVCEAQWMKLLRIYRVDVYCDFAYDGGFDPDQFCTRLKRSGFFQDGEAVDGKTYYFGSRGSRHLFARLYCKSVEIQHSGKEYMKSLWEEHGHDGVIKVWRVEYEYGKYKLEEIMENRHLISLDGEAYSALMSYGIKELEYKERKDSGGNLYRVPNHVTWQYLQSVLLTNYPDLKRRRFKRATLEWKRRRLRKRVMSFLAESGFTYYELPDVLKQLFLINEGDYRRAMNRLELGDWFVTWQPEYWGIETCEEDRKDYEMIVRRCKQLEEQEAEHRRTEQETKNKLESKDVS